MTAIENVFNLTEIKEFQKAALNEKLKQNDVFLSVKAEAGKFIRYQAFHPMWRNKNTDMLCSVFVLCPLISKIRSKRITCVGLDYHHVHWQGF